MENSAPFEEEGPFEPDGDDEHAQVAFVSTQQTVPLMVDEVEDDRTPDGMVCMGVFFRERLIARSIVLPEALAQLEAQEIFSDPVRLGLAAIEEDPGLQCRLFALLPASRFQDQEPQQEKEPEEPWAASVPRFEDIMEAENQDEESDELGDETIVPILLGHVVRFGRDRKHPDSLAEEAADVLRAILSEDRPLTNIVDKLLEDL